MKTIAVIEDDVHISDMLGELLSREGGQALLQVTIHQGKNRQIRRMCRQVGLSVRRLQRIREDCLQLGGLKPGKWRYLTDIEIQELKKVIDCDE